MAIRHVLCVLSIALCFICSFVVAEETEETLKPAGGDSKTVEQGDPEGAGKVGSVGSGVKNQVVSSSAHPHVPESEVQQEEHVESEREKKTGALGTVTPNDKEKRETEQTSDLEHHDQVGHNRGVEKKPPTQSPPTQPGTAPIPGGTGVAG
ncbi:uncharacterized protein TM35_000671230, partial [Trypanosoma theileri]